ncbi:MAG TPA: aldo/keto reductase [Aeromicrobium sp.]|nr:aldo/keto reductase [Aeromicrobium sp.]HKY57759.1 aldo/keto reductase [Aeromicrobium sp.]
METVNDLELPRVGIGCNAFGARVDAERVVEIVDAAIEQGAAFFDTADVYGFGASEELLGAAIRGRRDSVIVATKFGMDVQGINGPDDGRRGSAAYIRASIDASLRRLNVDYVDLYQFHTPDRETPMDETLGALNELVEAGKVRAIGCSNLRAWEVVDANWRARTAGTARFVTAQNEYSLYNRSAEDELLPACVALDVGVLPYFPLAYGLLTGKYRRGVAAPPGSRLAGQGQAQRLERADWDRIEALQQYADDRDLSLLQVALGGLAAQPAVVSVIAGVTTPAQVAANVEAGGWTPTADELAELNALKPRHPNYVTYAT